MDGKVDKKDLISTIVYLADKGYLEIEEISRKNFRFIGIKDPGPEVPDYVRKMYFGIFPGEKRVRTSTQLASSHTFGDRFVKAKEKLEGMYEGNKAIIRPDSRMARAGCSVAAIVPSAAYVTWAGVNGDEMDLFMLGWAAVHILISVYLMCSVYDNVRGTSKVKTVLKSLGAIWFFTVGVGILPLVSDAITLLSRPQAMALVLYLVIGTLVSMFFAVIAIARTDAYTDLLGRVLGFRDFIKTAELDKLNELGRMMSDCNASVNNSIVIPSSSGGSGGGWSSGGSGGGSSWSGGGGFSGGGFSGGGSGGGGGGGW